MSTNIAAIDVQPLIRQIKMMENRVKNISPAAMAPFLLEAVEEMFDTEGASGTEGKWDGFEDTTLERHPRRIGGQLLQDTGLLANIQVDEVDDESVTIASPAPYSGWHVTGTSRMPARDFFAIDLNAVLEEMGDAFLVEVVN